MKNVIIQKIQARKNDLGMSLVNLSGLSKVSKRTLNRLFAGSTIQTDTLEHVTDVLGLNIAGTKIKTVEMVKKEQANKKARYIVALTQDTSKMEVQGVSQSTLNSAIINLEQEFLDGAYKKDLWSL
ncbi:hypothetical protein COB57_01245 [Candidatus Peregrinibacteria bacterium]|nr:MAG: hypothetical protein COB57_01245 [Candidatus Peregrinibacteria bacterium]